MIKKKLFLCLAFCVFFCGTAFAQEQAQMASITKLNEKINAGIAEDNYYVHRINLNSFNKVWPGLSKYNESLNCYFELENGQTILRKIVIISQIAARQSYADYVYDKQGNVTHCLYNYDATKAAAPKSTYFFLGRQLVGISVNGEARGKSQLTTEDAQAGVEMMQRADAYKAMYDAISKIQLASSATQTKPKSQPKSPPSIKFNR